MRPKTVYLVLCLLGAILPYWVFLPWLSAHRFDIPLLIHELFANRISTFFGLDVILSALTLLIWIAIEHRRQRLWNWWLPVLAVLLVGVSLGLPLLLYLREHRAAQNTAG